MQVEMLRMVSVGFVGWLRTQFQPSGQPILHTLEAEMTHIIDLMPKEEDDASPASFTEQTVRDAVAWLMKSYAAAWSEKKNAVLAAHALRLLADRNAAEIIKHMMALPANHDK